MILGIRLLDHSVLDERVYFSFAAAGRTDQQPACLDNLLSELNLNKSSGGKGPKSTCTRSRFVQVDDVSLMFFLNPAHPQ